MSDAYPTGRPVCYIRNTDWMRSDERGKTFVHLLTRPKAKAMILLPNKFLSTSHHTFLTTLRRRLTTTLRRRLTTTTTLSSSSQETPHFMSDYLITTCGFPPDKAPSAALPLRRIKSPHQPDAVLAFLRSHNFSTSQIQTLISYRPRCLAADVDATLAPRFLALRSLGFLPSDIPHLVLSHPDILTSDFTRTVLPKLRLWTALLGSTACLMKFLTKNQWILGYSLAKTVLPNLALLRTCGIPDAKISMVVKHHPRFILQRPTALRRHAELVEGLGIPKTSGMFLWALQAVRMVSGVRFKAKLELMKSLGWSELEFLAAFRRAPVFLSVSEATMRKKMSFLVGEAGCDPSYLACHPVLLMYSLEKRFIPRYRVMEVLKARGLRGGDYKLHTIMDYPEKKFMEKFVLCHREEVPELYQMYISSRLPQGNPNRSDGS